MIFCSFCSAIFMPEDAAKIQKMRICQHFSTLFHDIFWGFLYNWLKIKENPIRLLLWLFHQFFVLLPPEKNMMKNRSLIIVLSLVLAVCSCQKPVEYPIEPKITYEGFTYLLNADSTFSGEGIVSFSYTDGDGDLGLDDSDTLPPFGFHDTH